MHTLATTPADYFARIIDSLLQAVAEQGGKRIAGPLTMLIWSRLRRMVARFAAIAAAVHAGTTISSCVDGPLGARGASGDAVRSQSCVRPFCAVGDRWPKMGTAASRQTSRRRRCAVKKPGILLTVGSTDHHLCAPLHPGMPSRDQADARRAAPR
jgi:hypothetical protein